MTDRVHALTVVLDKDYRDDDVQLLVDAIKMLRGVVAVELNVVEVEDYIARARVQDELRGKLRDVLWPSLT